MTSGPVGRIMRCVAVVRRDVVPERTPGFGYVEHGERRKRFGGMGKGSNGSMVWKQIQAVAIPGKR